VKTVIKLTLYNDADLVVNADMIESVEKTPDTIISLTTGKKVMVKESVEDVVGKVIAYRRLISKSGRTFGARGQNLLRTEMRGFETWT
jgi:flagellar protein FlbD